HIPIRPRRQPPLGRQLLYGRVKALPLQVGIGVVEAFQLQLSDKRHWFGELEFYFLGCTVCLRLAPGVNFGALDALIFTFSPVRGLTPWRAARLTTENLPKPVMTTSSPF